MQCASYECRNNFEGFCLIDSYVVIGSNGICFDYDPPYYELSNMEMFERRRYMTCREKLKMEHPEWVDVDCLGGCVECPSHYGYLDDPEYCPIKRKNEEESFLDLVDNMCDETCRKCWNRKVHEKEGFVKYEYELYNENGMLRGTCTIPAKYNPIDIPDEVVKEAIFDTMNIVYTKPLSEEKKK